MKRALEWVRRRRSDLLLLLAIGTFLTIISPFGATDRLGFGWAWIYWTGLVALGAMAGHAASQALPRILPPDPPRWLVWLLLSAATTLAVTPAIVLVQWLSGARVPWGFIPRLFFFVWVISAAITAVSMLVEAVQAGAGGAGPQPGRALTDKLPPRLKQARILSLEAEDHYLRVRTDRGEALVLMRLSDAVAALSGLDGAQTHRSWWVARDAVTDAETGGGRAVLALSDGVKAPVSRGNFQKLRQAGWF